MRPSLLATIGLLLVAPLAQGFELIVRGNHDVIPPDELREMTLRIASSIKHRIPDTPAIKVVVTAKARLRKQTSFFLYYHRIQLKKAFSGDPPYPVRAWLPIKSVEHYGVARDTDLRREFSATVREFFTALSSVDPQTQAP